MTLQPRRPTVPVAVGPVAVGGNHPVVVQSMTDTDTADAAATARQAADLFRAGSELVRITVNSPAAARAVPEVHARLLDEGLAVPLIGDFHYNGHLLLAEHPRCAATLAKYRINPGNVGKGRGHDENFAAIARIALEHGKPLRIGVNAGSLDQALLDELMEANGRRAEPRSAEQVLGDAMVESALRSAELAEACGVPHDRLILSCKMSRVAPMVEAYRNLAARTDLPLHLGLTEAGMGTKGIVASTAALSLLLAQGIGDTIRVSLTPDPGGDRTQEVRVAQQVLQSLGVRPFLPSVTACPGCGRTTSSFFRELARNVENYMLMRMPLWKREHPGVEEMVVAVMGCVVNGPGESKAAHIGISLPGTGEEPRAPVYVDGRQVALLEGRTLARDFQAMVEEYVKNRFPAPGSGAMEV